MIPYIHPRRKNLFQRSYEFNYWANQHTQIVPDTITNPWGNMTASTYRKSTTNNTFTRQLYLPYTIPNNTLATMSIFAKKKELNMIWLQYVDQATDQYAAVFDLETGIIRLQSANCPNASIIKLQDDWFRCQVTFNVNNPSGGNVPRLIFMLAHFNGTSSEYFFPDSTTRGIYIYGAQLEYNSFSRHISTTGVAIP